MTLVLTLGNRDQVIQVSDRHLSWNGRLVDDESNKADVLTCMNAKLAIGFKGLARYGEFDTRYWVVDALYESSPPDYLAREIIERFRERASETFSRKPMVHNIPRSHKRLSIMFSGYLYHHEPPLIGYAIVTNYQDFETGRDSPEAWDEFTAKFWNECRSLDWEPTLVQRVGNWRAMRDADVAALRALLQARKLPRAIIGKGVELMREMADRPAAQGTIGKQISTIYIPLDPSKSVESGYYSRVRGYVV